MTPLTLLPDHAEGSAILAEKFASFQGEGPWMGQRCAFIRFSRCNLRCGWCDSKYTWDWTQYRPQDVSEKMSLRELVSWVRDRDVDMMVLTGGEPMLQQAAMSTLAAGLPGVRVQVETNGTIAPSPELVELVDLWVVSPKLANSGVEYGKRIVPAALAALSATGRVAFKFVVTDPAHDLDEIQALVDEHQLGPVWVMPEGDTPDKVLAGMNALCAPAAERKWNISSRLHTLTGAR